MKLTLQDGYSDFAEKKTNLDSPLFLSHVLAHLFSALDGPSTILTISTDAN